MDRKVRAEIREIAGELEASSDWLTKICDIVGSEVPGNRVRTLLLEKDESIEDALQFEINRVEEAASRLLALVERHEAQIITRFENYIAA